MVLNFYVRKKSKTKIVAHIVGRLKFPSSMLKMTFLLCGIEFYIFSSDSLSRYVRHGTRWPKPCPQLKATTTTAAALDSFLTTAWQPAAPDYTPTWHVTTQLTARHHLNKGESAQCVVVQLKLQISLCLKIIFLTLLRRAKIFHRIAVAPYTIDRPTNISLRFLTLAALPSQ